jgi:two-component system, chemotaxis family, response regulator PixG
MVLPSHLMEEFKICTQTKYSGKLEIKTVQQGKVWGFYFQLGQVVWATGGTHPFRRWRRQMGQNCPQVDISKIQLTQENLKVDFWDYRLVSLLYKTQKINQEQVSAIVLSIIDELLFDLVQLSSVMQTTSDRYPSNILEAIVTPLGTGTHIKNVQESWQGWSGAGLAKILPDFAPLLKKPEELQQKVSSPVYNNFVRLLNGRLTLRDLAVQMKQNPQSLSRSLISYIQLGIIQLVQVSDTPLPVVEAKQNPNPTDSIASTNPPTVAKEVQKNLTPTTATTATTATIPTNPTQTLKQNLNAPLIICIDDSPQVCEMLDKMLTSKGFRYIGIQDPVAALPILIERKPDFIFLDLIMPVTNGYELCSKLRKISLFAKTPIVILTGNDSPAERTRSQQVGANDFITKPVDQAKVFGAIQAYLPSFSKGHQKANA